MSLIKHINPESLAQNLDAIRQLVNPQTIVAPVIKSNAYGHGLLETAAALKNQDTQWLTVNTLEEAYQISQAFPNHFEILVVGPLLPKDIEIIPHIQNLHLSIYSRAHLEWLNSILHSTNMINVHLKVDTGMSRQGIQSNEALNLINEIKNKYPKINTEGIWTHFATAADLDENLQFHPMYVQQKQTFLQLLNELQTNHLLPPLIHAANSAATIIDPEVHFNLVRPGMCLYGYYPSDQVKTIASQQNISFKPILTLTTSIVNLKTVPAESCVSYGCTADLSQETTIALLPIGYNDGLRTALSNQSHVIIHSQRARIIGNITMNMTMVDTTHIPQAKIGDTVTIIGTDGSQTITVDDHAQLCNTINYEILCGFK